MTTAELTPEYHRALQHLERNLDELHIFPRRSISPDMLLDNNMQLIEIYSGEKMSNKQFPKGSFWRWNQTKRRREAFLNARNAVVSFAKFTPRRSSKKNNDELPSLKLWHFELKYTDCPQVIYHILWCEKGYNTLPSFSTFDVSMDDLTFLIPFMPNDAAQELFPNHYPQQCPKMHVQQSCNDPRYW
uniref:Uncharacterized protein n=1 Tax=Vannella robusta TaxID=1487602 RepID=A0A7S4IDP3_9EUKA|mmetsp:Transcript_24227/g.30823  ORF Transcript_24227/g.30823 Transcript_24227/m.30823 type:complete len:187 (+) Transcript_24227:222-782(+)